MKKKKILFHLNSLGMGGAERVVTLLSQYFVRGGYDVTITTLWQAEAEYQISDGIKRIDLGELSAKKKEVKGRGLLALRRFTLLRKTIKKECPDVVVSFCAKANFRSAVSMTGMKIPLVVSVRNNPERDYIPHKVLTKWMEKKASGCVFQTQEAKSFFSPSFQGKSCIIWNPVDEKYLSTGQRVEKKEQTQVKYIVTVGRLSRQKNQMLLLKAFRRVKDQFPHTRVRIYGEESEPGIREEMKAFLVKNNMEDRVEFMGHSDGLEKELPKAELFVLSSDYEGMPNALIEAMVLGLPVISTDCPCGGAAMLIENNISGILVPVGNEEKLANALERLLADRQWAGLIGQNARRVADLVRPQKIYEEWKMYLDGFVK